MYDQLKNYNLWLAILHLVLALGFARYFHSVNTAYPNDPIQGVELSTRNHNLAIGSNNQLEWKSALVQQVPIKTVQNLLVGFFFVTAVFHLIYFLTHEGTYSKMIDGGNNYLRWIEYSISSTMMLYIIAYISGVKDNNIYQMIFATNIAMIYTGQVVEERVKNGQSWYVPMAVGFMLLLAEFGVIIRDFRSRMVDIQAASLANPSLFGGRTIPSWIQYMVYVLFFFFSSFGFISLIGAYSGMKYENVEKLYILFSLLAKATLAGFIGYGTARRQSA